SILHRLSGFLLSPYTTLFRSTIVLFARTSHISSTSSYASIVVTNRTVEVCTNRHVQQRQSSNTPLMTVTGNSSKQAVTLEAGQHSKRAGIYSITLSILTSSSCNVVCQVNNLSAEFILLVYVIVKAVLLQLTHNRLNTGVTYNVQLAIEVICSHHNLKVTKYVFTLSPLSINSIRRKVIKQLILQNLSFVSSKLSKCGFIKLLSKCIQILHKFGFKIFLNANFIVHIHCRSNSKSPRISGKCDLNHFRSIFT